MILGPTCLKIDKPPGYQSRTEGKDDRTRKEVCLPGKGCRSSHNLPVHVIIDLLPISSQNSHHQHGSHVTYKTVCSLHFQVRKRNLLKSIKKILEFWRQNPIQIYFSKKWIIPFTYQFPKMVMQPLFWPGKLPFWPRIDTEKSEFLGDPRCGNPDRV